MSNGLSNSIWARNSSNQRYRPAQTFEHPSGNPYSHSSRAHRPYSNTAPNTFQYQTSTIPINGQSHPFFELSSLLANALNRIPTPEAELSRYSRIVRRLKWKLPYLAHGYQQATITQPPSSSHDNEATFITKSPSPAAENVSREGIGEQTAPAAAAAIAHQPEAELMFKLDFFEYYMLLERALVHLLGVYGVLISRSSSSNAAPALPHSDVNGSTPPQGHSYHANVLDALDRPDNPLHPALGHPSVRAALGRAKELRNRWKHAADDDVDDDSGRAEGANQARMTALARYDLEKTLEIIFSGFDAGFGLAKEFVEEVKKARRGERGMFDEEEMDIGEAGGHEEEDGEEGWGFITGAMDWEAV